MRNNRSCLAHNLMLLTTAFNSAQQAVLALLVALVLLGPAAVPAVAGGSSFLDDPVRLTGDLIRKGLQLLRLPLIEINLGCMVNHFDHPRQQEEGRSRLEERLEALSRKLERETNPTLLAFLEAQKQQLTLDRERNAALSEQARLLRSVLDHQIRLFAYQQERDESLLRKLAYNIPADKLVVVVADFSTGNPDEGREIADEIAHHLGELTKHGIDVHVLVGEIKPGVVIRSAEMAADIGRHLPPGTSFVVLWGSMSPRTVGKYRPQLTFVQKATAARGACVSYNLALESVDLPLSTEKEKHRREAYLRLIGVTCAAIPNCYAAHEIGRERIPDLDRFFTFIGTATPEANKIRQELEPLTRWSWAKANYKAASLRSLTSISTKQNYPLTILNEKDDSVMVLITESSGAPKLFSRGSGTEKTGHITYIDVTEATNAQFLRFLNAEGNRSVGGTTFIKLDPSFRDIVAGKDGAFTLTEDRLGRFAVIDVSWFGAQHYCTWAGKELPTVEEWKAAAVPEKQEWPYPWGPKFDPSCCAHGNQNHPPGTRLKDRSRIGCFDMAGNVAEWCEDWHKVEKGEKKVMGGGFLDSDPALFTVTSVRGVPQATPQRGIGFRGVVRIPVKSEGK